MKKNKKLKNLLYLVLLFFFVLTFQTIAYSAINGTMTLSGDAYARAEADVRITNFRLANLTNATSHYEEFGKNHIVTEVDLNNSSSQITYYLEITNYGSVDIGIYDITGLPSGVNYSIKDYNLHDKICDDTGKCNDFIKKTFEITLTTTSAYSGQVQLNFDFRTYYKVTYNGITNNNYPIEVIDGGNLSITFKENLNRVQAIANENELAFYSSISNGQTITINNITNDIELKIKPQVAKLMNGSLTEVGSEVCIKDECFYVIKNDGTTVTLFSKYNLHIGCEYTDINEYIEYGTSATGLQNELMIGATSTAGYPRRGVTFFSNTSTDYDTSVVKEYVDNYNNYFKENKVYVNNIRLITKEELETLGCSVSKGTCLNSQYSWIYKYSYWILSTQDKNDKLWRVNAQGTIGSYPNYNFPNGFGVRPVIELSVDEVYNPYPIGEERCLGTECFHILSHDKNTVTMLAKYNLAVGKSFWGENEDYDPVYIPIENATGMQDENMKGETYNYEFPYNGVVQYGEFTNQSSYPTYVYDNQSNLYQYVENYKTKLQNMGYQINTARLISHEELKLFGCNIRDEIGMEMCLDAPPWIYSTTYWTGSATGDDCLASIFAGGRWYNTTKNDDMNYGVRPVINVPKNLLESLK